MEREPPRRFSILLRLSPEVVCKHHPACIARLRAHYQSSVRLYETRGQNLWSKLRRGGATDSKRWRGTVVDGCRDPQKSSEHAGPITCAEPEIGRSGWS